MVARSEPRGYIIPDEPDPEKYTCFTVWVPDDQVYTSQFWQAYEYFSKWVAWQRDGTDRGKQAAAVWRGAWELTMTGNDCEVEMIIDVRQSESDPCVLEKQLTTGEWVTFATITLCTGEPLFPEQGETLGGTTDDIVWFFKSLAETISDLAATQDKSATQVMFSSLIQQSSGVSDLIDAMYDHTAGERATALSGADWDEVRLAVLCDDSVSWDSWEDWLNNAAENLYDYLSAAGTWLFDALSSVVDSATPATIGLWGLSIAGGGAGFDAVYCWELDFDLTADDADFTTYLDYRPGYEDPVTDTGVWVSGQGWKSEYTNLAPSVWLNDLIAGAQFAAPARITSVYVKYYVQVVTIYASIQCQVNLDPEVGAEFIIDPEDITGYGVWPERTWTGEVVTSNVVPRCEFTHTSEETYFFCRIEHVTIKGIGSEPTIVPPA